MRNPEASYQDAQRPHPTAECDLIFRYKVSPPTGPLSYSIGFAGKRP